jgi:arabinogalactan oligomer/maltooligosaccharide transport system substrate-binding protein
MNKLAQYLSGEKAQLERFNAVGWGPSNVAAQGSDAVKAAPHLIALMKQNNYSRPQGQIHGSWWDIAKVIATDLKEGGEIKPALEKYNTSMNELFTMSDDVLNAWTVIGNINGDGWTVDLAMTEQADGTWKTTEAYEITDATEFKCRQGKSWDNNWGVNDDGTPAAGGGNCTAAKLGKTAGTYYVVLDTTTGQISLVTE